MSLLLCSLQCALCLDTIARVRPRAWRPDLHPGRHLAARSPWWPSITGRLLLLCSLASRRLLLTLHHVCSTMPLAVRVLPPPGALCPAPALLLPLPAPTSQACSLPPLAVSASLALHVRPEPARCPEVAPLAADRSLSAGHTLRALRDPSTPYRLLADLRMLPAILARSSLLPLALQTFPTAPILAAQQRSFEQR